MTNSEKFFLTFGFDISRLNPSSNSMLEQWATDTYVPNNRIKIFRCNNCNHKYLMEYTKRKIDDFGVKEYYSNCPICNNENVIYECEWH